MALSASESINSGLRTVVIAVLSATIPHRSTTTPKTKHTHRHASQWEKISYIVCIQGFSQFHRLCSPLLTPPPVLYWSEFLLLMSYIMEPQDQGQNMRVMLFRFTDTELSSSIDSVAQYDGKMRQHQVGLSENKWQEECSGWFIEEWSTSSTRCCFDVLCDV